MNSKASLLDSIYVPAYLLMLVATIFIGLYVWATFATGMQTVVNNTQYNVTVNDAINNITVGMSSFDYMFPIVLVGLLIISLIFAYKTGAGVIYAVLSVILWGFAVMMAWVYESVFLQFADSFPTIVAISPIMTYMMTNIKWVVLAWIFLISLVMFSRNKQEEQNLAAAESVFMR